MFEIFGDTSAIRILNSVHLTLIIDCSGGIVERDIEYIAEAVRRDIPFGAPCKGVAKILCCTGNQQVPYGPPSNEEPTINPNYEW
jgi:hypothetical protein